MKKPNKLESQILSLKVGGMHIVRDFKERARAQQIALRNGIKIKTRERMIGVGYEILREA